MDPASSRLVYLLRGPPCGRALAFSEQEKRVTMKLSKQLFVFSALLVIGGVVLLFTLRKAPIAHAATAPTLDWRTLPEDSPLDGAVTPAAFVLRADEGKIKIGDVITMANRAQPEAGLEQAKGRVFLFRGREITPLKPALEKTVNMKTKFVVRYFAYRPGSEVEIGDVITKINGAEFNSGDEFVRLARNANVITFLRNVGGQW